MTPRALLTAIGATALAFAVAIGMAADGTADIATGAASVTTTTTTGAERGADGRLRAADVEGARLAAWNDPGMVAV